MKKILAFVLVLLSLITGPSVIPADSAASRTPESAAVLSPDRTLARTDMEIVRNLSRYHYRRVSVDDELSSKIFDAYMEDLDPQRMFFLSTDIEEFEVYRYNFDDHLRTGELHPAFMIFRRFQSRVYERTALVTGLIDNGGIDRLKFDQNDEIMTDRKECDWAATEAESEILWKKRLKSDVLALRLAGKKTSEAGKTLKKRYENQANIIKQTKAEDIFQIYMNSFTRIYDPHTQYFSPRISENFNINMSLSLEGIGALLRSEDEYTKVVRLIPAGPAEKTGQLRPSDRIVGVGEGRKGNIVDVIGWRIDDVVDLIRGPKGTSVRLEVLPAGTDDVHETKIIEITRNTVKLEEQAAKKSIVELTDEKGVVHRIGVIDVPAFYMDFKALKSGDRNYKSTTRDVKGLLNELSTENVEGLVIDLRDNGGGSLQEANDLVGLFIRKGPTVQVRHSNGRVDVHRDRNPRIYYSGPLAVVVNRLSASASEIFAGAIQDYDRGIIIGETTYGKGTVQSLIPLDHGQLKATTAKFYRISGESTQIKGVTPDLSYPGFYDPDEIGESSRPYALEWDTIGTARYRTCDGIGGHLEELERRHISRMKNDPDYLYRSRMKEQLRSSGERNVLSLNEKIRRDERTRTQKQRLDIENDRFRAKNEKTVSSLDELETRTDTTEEDPVLVECGHVLLDLKSLQSQ